MNWSRLRKLPRQLQRHELDPSLASSNENLERLVAQFDSAENVTKLLYQSTKKLPDYILCAAKFENKLTDELTGANVFALDEFMRNVVDEWNSFAYLTNTIADEYVISIQRTLLDPLKRLRQTFCELRAAIRLHESLQYQVIKCQRKVASYNDKEKTGANLVKQTVSLQALTSSQKEFSRNTQSLTNDLTKFLSASEEMLQPLLEGFIAAEVAWIRACKRSMESKVHITTSTELSTQQDRLKTIEESFKHLAGLSICNPPSTGAANPTPEATTK